MSRNRSLRVSEILEVLQNIPEDQSDCEPTEEERHILHLDSESEESDCNITQKSNSSSDDDNTHSDSNDSTPLSTLRSTRGRGQSRSRGHRGRGSRVQTEIIHHNTDVAVSSSGVSWNPGNLSVLNQPGRRPRQNILTEEAGPTPFAKSRRKFILDLARELVGQDTHSLLTPSTSQPSNSIPLEPEEEPSRKRKRCFVQKCRTKTNNSCNTWKKPLCGSCNDNKEFKCQQCA
ncbi:hypothetical protein evm_004629 [Chilo suppressalis]|nr:hypothetical protein evm_004629 [Chilo suppressalis]